MQYTAEQLTQLLADVEKAFTVELTKAEENFRLAKSEGESAAPSVDGTETLAKAEDEKPAEAKDKKEDKKEDKSDAPPSEGKEEAPAKEAAPAEGEEEGEAPAAPAAEALAPAEGNASGYDADDLAHLAEMYASMSFEELMAHHDAVKEALDAKAAQDAAPAAPGAEGLAPAPAAEAAPAPAQAGQAEVDKSAELPMGKSENVQVDLVKSELAAEQAKSAELKKTLDAVSEFVTKLVAKKAAPAGKAITSLETIAKSEVQNEEKPLSKGEITALLSKKAADPKLSKSDREAINAYYGTGQVGLEKISHLLK